MAKLYLARHKRYDMYWGREYNRDMWTNDISAAMLLTKEQWEEIMAADDEFKDNVILYEKRYDYITEED